jgi:DNA-binding transcriptional MerR regulator
MSETVQPPQTGLLTIAAVEMETGLSKDVLRVWERRYGFPCPQRGPGGDRVYSADQLVKLKLVCRLVDAGLRPGRILPLPLEALRELAGEEPLAREGGNPVLQQAMRLLTEYRSGELRRELNQAILRDGLYRFITETAAPLSAMVGEAWTRGEIRIFEEHLFTETLTIVLRGAISQLPGSGRPPRVLLTTLPAEPHALGLLMAEAALSLEGADCVSLGTQTPVSDIAAAAIANRSDVVALSSAGNFPPKMLSEGLTALRRSLPPQVALWGGGAGMGRLRRVPEGVLRLTSLDDVGRALSEWRSQSSQWSNSNLSGGPRH